MPREPGGRRRGVRRGFISGRRFDQWLVVRLPALYRLVAIVVDRLPSGSGMRRAFLWRWAASTFDGYNRKDLKLLQPWATDDAEFFTFTEGRAENRPFRGREGVREWLQSDAETWQEINVEAHEIRDLGQRVLVIGRISGIGRDSGIELDSPAAWMFELRGGRVSYMRAYLDPAEALEAVGLRE